MDLLLFCFFFFFIYYYFFFFLKGFFFSEFFFNFFNFGFDCNSLFFSFFVVSDNNNDDFLEEKSLSPTCKAMVPYNDVGFQSKGDLLCNFVEEDDDVYDVFFDFDFIFFYAKLFSYEFMDFIYKIFHFNLIFSFFFFFSRIVEVGFFNLFCYVLNWNLMSDNNYYLPVFSSFCSIEIYVSGFDVSLFGGSSFFSSVFQKSFIVFFNSFFLPISIFNFFFYFPFVYSFLMCQYNEYIISSMVFSIFIRVLLISGWLIFTLKVDISYDSLINLVHFWTLFFKKFVVYISFFYFNFTNFQLLSPTVSKFFDNGVDLTFFNSFLSVFSSHFVNVTGFMRSSFVSNFVSPLCFGFVNFSFFLGMWNFSIFLFNFFKQFGFGFNVAFHMFFHFVFHLFFITVSLSVFLKKWGFLFKGAGYSVDIFLQYLSMKPYFMDFIFSFFIPFWQSRFFSLSLSNLYVLDYNLWFFFFFDFSNDFFWSFSDISRFFMKDVSEFNLLISSDDVDSSFLQNDFSVSTFVSSDDGFLRDFYLSWDFSKSIVNFLKYKPFYSMRVAFDVFDSAVKSGLVSGDIEKTMKMWIDIFSFLETFSLPVYRFRAKDSFNKVLFSLRLFFSLHAYKMPLSFVSDVLEFLEKSVSELESLSFYDHIFNHKDFGVSFPESIFFFSIVSFLNKSSNFIDDFQLFFKTSLMLSHGFLQGLDFFDRGFFLFNFTDNFFENLFNLSLMIFFFCFSFTEPFLIKFQDYFSNFFSVIVFQAKSLSVSYQQIKDIVVVWLSFFDFVLFNNASFLFKEVFFGKFLLDCIFFLFDFLNGVAFKSSFFFSFYGQHFILFLFSFFFDQLIFFFDSCSFGGNHIFDNNLFSSLSLSNSYSFKSRFKRDSFVLSESNIFSFSLKDVNLLSKSFLIKQMKFIIDSLFKGDNSDFFNFFSFGSFSGIFDFSVNLFVLSFLFFSLDFSFFFFMMSYCMLYFFKH